MAKLSWRNGVGICLVWGLLALPLGAQTGPAAPEPLKSALLIANGEYGSLGRLSQPVPEARQLKAVLDTLGFQTRLLENASREAMIDALIDFRNTLNQRGGLAFFHYGGHAVQVQGQNYLLPANAVIPDEERVASRAVSLDEVTRTLGSSRAATSILVLDACRNNPLPVTAGRSATRGLTVLGAEGQAQGQIVVYSAQAGAVAQDGVFTPALTRALNRPQAFHEILQSVAVEVQERTNGAQRPFTYADLSLPAVYLAGRPQASPAAPATPATPSATQPSFGPVRVAGGRILVVAGQAGRVTLLGQSVDLPAGGQLPVSEVPPGTHALEFRPREGRSEQRQVTVRAGEETRVELGLSAAPTTPAAPPVAPAPAASIPAGPGPESGALRLEMIQVAGGRYRRGAENGRPNERPVHEVSVSPFWISRTEITQEQYQRVTGRNPSRFKDGPEAPQRPVDSVSWYDAIQFCNSLSRLEGLTPVYTQTLLVVTADWNANGYRLPTEAEWEFAARAGAGNPANLGEAAWFEGNSSGRPQPVGAKRPNALGLYDMLGNVWEWVWDLSGSYGPEGLIDPRGPQVGTHRLFRGGSWRNPQAQVTVSSRQTALPNDRDNRIGFRVARNQP